MHEQRVCMHTRTRRDERDSVGTWFVQCLACSQHSPQIVDVAARPTARHRSGCCRQQQPRGPTSYSFHDGSLALRTAYCPATSSFPGPSPVNFF
jgi:hypothetical protein